MIKLLDTRNDDVLSLLRKRTIHRDEGTELTVRDIIEDVRRRGDEALLESARRFDSPEVDSLVVDFAEIGQTALPKLVLDAIERSMLQVQAFHARQL
ncbi:MAG TPA: histidinol dehydrogenase, partial [Fimbriimonas sp.]